jgi:hypothetical protein
VLSSLRPECRVSGHTFGMPVSGLMTGAHVARAAEPKAAVHVVARNALGCTGRIACRARSLDGAGAVLRRLRGFGEVGLAGRRAVSLCELLRLAQESLLGSRKMFTKAAEAEAAGTATYQ